MALITVTKCLFTDSVDQSQNPKLLKKIQYVNSTKSALPFIYYIQDNNGYYYHYIVPHGSIN